VSSNESTCGRGLHVLEAEATTNATSSERARGAAGVSRHTIAHAPTTTAAAKSVSSGKPPAA